MGKDILSKPCVALTIGLWFIMAFISNYFMIANWYYPSFCYETESDLCFINSCSSSNYISNNNIYTEVSLVYSFDKAVNDIKTSTMTISDNPQYCNTTLSTTRQIKCYYYTCDTSSFTINYSDLDPQNPSGILGSICAINLIVILLAGCIICAGFTSGIVWLKNEFW